MGLTIPISVVKKDPTGNFARLRAGRGLRLYGSTSGYSEFAPGSTGDLTIVGGSRSGGNLTLQSTAHGTRGQIVASDVIYAPQGAVGSPAYSFSGDPDTGWWNKAPNVITASLGGGAHLQMAAGVVQAGSTTVFGWASGGSAISSGADTALGRNAAGIVEINNGTAGTMRDLMLRSLLGKPGSGSNAAGSNVTIAPGPPTGNHDPASIILQSTVAGSSGSTAQGLFDTLTVTNGRVGIGTTSPSSLLTISSGNDQAAGTPTTLTYGTNGYTAPSNVGTTANGDKAVMWNTVSYKGAWGLAASGSMWFQSTGDGSVGGQGNIQFYGGRAGSPVSTMIILGDGKVGIGTAEPTALLDINSDVLRLRTAKTPASASATGNAGDICWDSGFIYVCTATDTWERAVLASW